MHHFIWSSCQKLRLLLCDGFFSYNFFFFFFLSSYLYFTFISLGHFSGSFLVLYSFFFLSSFSPFHTRLSLFNTFSSLLFDLFLFFFSSFFTSHFYIFFFFFLGYFFISALGTYSPREPEAGASEELPEADRQTDDDLMRDAQTQGNLLLNDDDDDDEASDCSIELSIQF